MHESTKIRYTRIVNRLNELIKLEGEKAAYLTRSYFYNKISDETGESISTIVRAVAKIESDNK